MLHYVAIFLLSAFMTFTLSFCQFGSVFMTFQEDTANARTFWLNGALLGTNLVGKVTFSPIKEPIVKNN